MKRTINVQVQKGGNGGGDLTVDQRQLLVMSELVGRLGLAARLGLQYGANRDLYEALGYKNTIEYNDYLAYYKRHDIAKAIIKRPVSAAWQGDLRIYEEGVERGGKLEGVWEELEEQLKLKGKLMQLDRLCGIGQYAVLLLGLDDVKVREQWEKPVVNGPRKLLYVKPFGQGSARIRTFESSPKNPRYGLPLYYDIDVQDVNSNTSQQIIVHYSRVVHVIDDPLESETYGTPRLEAVFNRLMDLEKLVGGSAEMFWRGARPGYAGTVDKDFMFSDEDKEELQEQLDEYEHNLRRILLAEGLDLRALAQQVSDPKNHVDVQIQMISAVTGIPKRILMGSERGELASTQDREEWLTYVQTRRGEFIEPAIVRPFVGVCMKYNILPTVDNYQLEWNDLWAPNEKEWVEIGRGRAEALGRYATTPFAESVVSPQGFLKYFLGLKDAAIRDIMKMLKEEQNKEIAQQATVAEENVIEEGQKVK